MVKQKLRLVGRFFLSVRQLDKSKTIKTLSDVYHPRHYDISIEAVRDVAGYDPELRTFRSPSVASNLGTLLKYIGTILRSECIKKEMSVEQRKTEDFMKLLEEDFGTSINREVAETQTQNNRRKEVILPSTDDIKKFHTYIKCERSEHFNQLTQAYSFEAWKNLGKMTLLSLQIFNRRRPGEIERLYLEDFQSYRSLDHTANKEAYNALSEEGKKLARKYVRFEIRGKLGRGVPVLVDNDVLNCLNLLIEHRERAGVPPDNRYLFGLPSSDKDRLRYHRACELMREYSTKCRAENPQTLRATQLRKHIATRCINLNLTDGQVTDLANFMGHHEKIHKEIYRQPVLETDIVKISKLLKTAQGCDESDDSENEGVIDGSSFQRNVSTVEFDEPSTSRTSSGSKFNKSLIQSDLQPSTSKRWSEQERSTVLSAFNKHLTAGKMPSGAEMQSLIDSNTCLKLRTVPQLRTWLHTQKKKMSKK
ncbi:uncharacterized protein LOC107047038 [Diachasma alloeum]|nr:uncharacterized protein LOC107047038 [Diachasma alloeum]